MQKIQLAEGQYTPSEASDLLSSLFDGNVNFHKIQRWISSIHDETADTQHLSGKIAALQKKKKAVKEFIAMARAQGYHVRINGSLEITLEK